MTPARILLAEEAAILPTVTSALVGYELLATVSLRQAERLILEDGIDLFVVGIHFDDSRAMELIKKVRLDRKHGNTPIIIHRLSPSEHAELLKQTLDVMRTMNIISDYLEVEGDPDAKSKIRKAVEQYLPTKKLARCP